jgi:hypothetical protein
MASFVCREGKTRPWLVQVRHRGRKPMSKTFVTRRDAERWARRTEAALDKGVLPGASQVSRITVAEALNRYPWPNSREQGRAKRLTQALGAYTLATLTPGVLSSYRDSRLQVVGANTG